MAKHSQYLIKNCIVCGKAFRTSRFHAKTCSNACRMKLSRGEQRKKTPAETVTNVTYIQQYTLADLDAMLRRESEVKS